MRFAVVHHIQPVASPALAVAGRGEQPVHQFFVSVGRLVCSECSHLLGSGRQTVKIVSKPADQRPPIRLGRRMKALFTQLRRNERVYGLFALKAHQRLQGPPLVSLCPGRALLDPVFHSGHFSRRERFALARHARLAA